MKLSIQIEKIISVIVFALVNGAITVKEATRSEQKSKSPIGETIKSDSKNFKAEAKGVPEPSPVCGNFTDSKIPIQRKD